MSQNGKQFLRELEALVKRHASIDEGGLNTSLKKLADAEAQLPAMFSEPELAAEARRLHAEIAMVTKRWVVAAERWRACLPAGTNSDPIHCKIATAYRRGGDLFNAKLALEAVGKKFRKRQRYLNELARIDEANDKWAAIHLSFRAFDAVAASRFEQAHALIGASVALQARRNEDLAQIAAIVDLIFDFLRDDAEPEEPACEGANVDRRPKLLQALFKKNSVPKALPSAEPFRHPRLIAIGGFGWSGSGAVADYLKGSSAVRLATGDTELNLFEGQCAGVLNALELIREAPHLDRDDWRRSVVGLMLWAVLAVAFPRAKAADVQRWHNKSLLRAAGGNPRRLVEPIRSLLAACACEPRDPDDIGRAIATMFFRTIRRQGDEQGTMVLNNSIHGKSMELLRIFDNAMGIAVLRDPRDQYVARVMENSRITIKCDRFIANLKDDLLKYRRALQHEKVSKSVREIRFETFVLDAEARAQLARDCGLDPNEIERCGTFNPEKSARNIGIHKAFRNQSDIRKIEAAFPDLLHD